MRSTKGYTEEQRDEAVKLYQECPDMLVSQIADKLGISDPSTISHWVKELGLPLRAPKSSGWVKNATTSHKQKGKFAVCPNCKKRFKLREDQKFCHICGADITPVEVKCKKHVENIQNYYMSKFFNPHTMKHEELVNCIREFVSIIDEACEDLVPYFEKF